MTATERRKIRVVGAMLEREPGRYLITQRSKNASLPLLWEFPGGRVQEPETDQEALVRELSERLGLQIVVDSKATHMQHEYPAYDIEFSVFHCRLKDPTAEVRSSKVNDHRWVGLGEMSQYQFPDADQRTLAKLLDLDH